MALRRSSKKAAKGADEPLGEQVSARIFKKDNKPFAATVRGDFNGNESLAVRVLIREALTARRLKGIGQDTSLDAVKNAQQEVIAGETDEIKAMLRDVLAIVRGSGTSIDRVVGQNREIYGVIFHILRTVFNVEEMSQEYLARPALEAEGKDDKGIGDAFAEAEKEWTEQAHIIIESVRTQLSQSNV